MADEFDAAGISWWSTARTSSSTPTTSFEGSAAISAASASCSASMVDVGSGPLIYSSPSLQVPGFGMDWNQSLLRSSNSTGRAHDPSSFHAMLQDSLNYPQEQFLINHGHHQQQQKLGTPMLLQGLFDTTEVKPQAQSIFDQQSLNYQPSRTMTTMMMGTSDFQQYLKSSPPKQQQVSSVNHLQFSNNRFWDASASPVSSDRSGFYPSMMPVKSYEQKPSCSSLTTTKSNSDSVQKRTTGSGGGSSEPALQKTRVETPSPLPAFKVRKEKLGDRITALQQLVSPFGKTDTASVLYEAIEYIKFLHDQVVVLSTPCLKNGHPMQHQQQSSATSKDGEGPEQDLRSRGLCLVPIEITYPLASETTADFWTPTFGGSYR